MSRKIAFAPLRTEPPPAEKHAADWTTRGVWFGPVERPLAGWWTQPSHPSRSGVVIAAPLGHDYWTTHHSLRLLAEALARAGWNVLRFDWDGTGDSAGNAGDLDRVTAWRASLAHAMQTMREAGMTRIALVGLHFGATLALLDAAALGVGEVVACMPVAGHQFLRDLRALGIADPRCPGRLVESGLVIDPTTAAELGSLDLTKVAPPRVSRTLLVTQGKPGDDALVRSIGTDGRELAVSICTETQCTPDMWIENPPLPGDFSAPIVAWLGNVPACTLAVVPGGRDSAMLPWDNGMLCERFTRIANFNAVVSIPIDRRHAETIVVFVVNPGSEPHVGTGRAWVEYARALALKGYACVRADFSGHDENPDTRHPPGRSDDPTCIAEVLRMVVALRERYPRIVLVGLRAGAWAALKAAQQVQIEGVFALSPQLYWRSGDAADTWLADADLRRPRRRRREPLGARTGWRSLLDFFVVRPTAMQGLRALRNRHTPVMLSFADGDAGLAYLRDRCHRGLTRELRWGYLAIEEVPGMDCRMLRLWCRPAVIEQLSRFLDLLSATADLD